MRKVTPFCKSIISEQEVRTEWLVESSRADTAHATENAPAESYAHGNKRSFGFDCLALSKEGVTGRLLKHYQRVNARASSSWSVDIVIIASCPFTPTRKLQVGQAKAFCSTVT